MSWNVAALVEYEVKGTWTMEAPPLTRRNRKRERSRVDPEDLRHTPRHLWFSDYPLAALLTGWDPDARGPLAIAPGRGLPDDASASASTYGQAILSDVTWMSGREILDYPLWDEDRDAPGPSTLDLGQFAAGLRFGFDPRIERSVRRSSARFGHEWRVTPAEMQRFIDGLGGPGAALAMWLSEKLREDAAQAWRRAHRDRPPLTEVHAPPPEWDGRPRFHFWELLALVDEAATVVGGDPNKIRLIAGLNGRGERWGC